MQDYIQIKPLANCIKFLKSCGTLTHVHKHTQAYKEKSLQQPIATQVTSTEMSVHHLGSQLNLVQVDPPGAGQEDYTGYPLVLATAGWSVHKLTLVHQVLQLARL